MGRKKISIDELRDEVNKILEQYSDDIDDCLDKESVQYAKITKAELQPVSPVGKHTPKPGHYQKGWAYKKSKSKKKIGATVYNKAAGPLTHLLEHGHALRQGGRSPAIVHIKPVEEKIVKEFESEVKDKLMNL